MSEEAEPVADADRPPDQRPDAASARLERAALVSVLVGVGLVVLKAGFALLSGSVGLLAETIHSAADALASAAVLAGLKISRRKSPSFPYGLYKVENLVALALAAVIFAAAYAIGREALFAGTRKVTHVFPSLGALAAALLATIALARYKMAVGRAFNSPSLIADGQHSWVDVFSSGAVAVGLIGTRLGFPLDRVAAGVVVLFILRLGGQTLVEAVRVLLDSSLDRPTLDRARAIITGEPGVQEIVELAGRSSGRYRFIEAELVLRVRDLEKAHRIADRIEHRLRDEIKNVDHVVIHCEPTRKDTWRYAIPLADRQGNLSPHLGEAPLFALADVRVRDRQVLRVTVVENPSRQLEKGRGIGATEFLVEQSVDVLVLRERPHGRGPAYVLRDAGVELELTDQERLDGALRHLGLPAPAPDTIPSAPTAARERPARPDSDASLRRGGDVNGRQR